MINEKYQLNTLFQELSIVAKSEVHSVEFKDFSNRFISFYNHFDLSLRDIDSCIRSMFFVAKNIQERHYMYPFLIGALIILRLQQPSLYREFFKGKYNGGDIMNYIDEKMPDVEPHDPINKILREIELYLYVIDGKALNQLDLLSKDELLTHPEYLSKKTRKDKERAEDLLSHYNEFYLSFRRTKISYISKLIELTNIE